jgi:CDP-diacylglycerol--glycerol-3-phosphate 3-phosphatidyltransferase
VRPLLAPDDLPRLERAAWRTTITGALALGAAAVALALALDRAAPHAAAGFLAGALAVWFGLARALHTRLALNVLVERPDALLPSFGGATTLTLFRGLLISVVGGFVLLPPRPLYLWIAGPVYAIAAILDGCDGALARRTGRATRLGAALDVTTDAVGLLVAPLVAVRGDRLPPWYLLLALAYPLFRAGLWLRARLGLATHPERLRPDPRARFFAGVQMACVATALHPVLPRWFLWPAATIVMLPTLALFVGEWRLATARDPRPEPLAPPQEVRAPNR